MSAEQFDQVVTAIVEGKYSWACVLILRYAGYNPAHYLPYRTYKRLIKDNRPRQTTGTQSTRSSDTLVCNQQALGLTSATVAVEEPPALARVEAGSGFASG
ncbi:HetP family heterocyst commitment protein [Leptolyngbya subtilissima ST-M1]